MQGGNIVVASSYSTAHVTATTDTGGLVGLAFNFGHRTIVNSYATGWVDNGIGGEGGLVGFVSLGTISITASYWDRRATNQGGSVGGGTAKTTGDLQTPTAYGSGPTDIYAAWDDYDNNGDGAVDADDDAWDFGSAWNYPALKYGGHNPAAQRVDYDGDGDGLIEVDSLAKLNAVRWDLDGDGSPGATSHGGLLRRRRVLQRGFHRRRNGSRLSDDFGRHRRQRLSGYELANDLDFDTNGSGDVDGNDAYPNWTPIGGSYSAVFEGNNRVISNLTIDAADSAGLFTPSPPAAPCAAWGWRTWTRG